MNVHQELREAHPVAVRFAEQLDAAREARGILPPVPPTPVPPAGKTAPAEFGWNRKGRRAAKAAARRAARKAR